MLVCFEYRVGGRGKRRGFAHAACVAQYWDTQVVVPHEDLVDINCVLCEQPMLSKEKANA